MSVCVCVHGGTARAWVAPGWLWRGSEAPPVVRGRCRESDSVPGLRDRGHTHGPAASCQPRLGAAHLLPRLANSRRACTCCRLKPLKHCFLFIYFFILHKLFRVVSSRGFIFDFLVLASSFRSLQTDQTPSEVLNLGALPWCVFPLGLKQ